MPNIFSDHNGMEPETNHKKKKPGRQTTYSVELYTWNLCNFNNNVIPVDAIKRKRKDIVTHATTWMDLEDITLGERGQSQQDKYSDSSHVISPEQPWV